MEKFKEFGALMDLKLRKKQRCKQKNMIFQNKKSKILGHCYNNKHRMYIIQNIKIKIKLSTY